MMVHDLKTKNKTKSCARVPQAAQAVNKKLLLSDALASSSRQALPTASRARQIDFFPLALLTRYPYVPIQTAGWLRRCLKAA
eukprot:scaffold19798_cov146-Isochrysis_galbana.AAC.4